MIKKKKKTQETKHYINIAAAGKPSYLSFLYKMCWEILKNQSLIMSQSGQDPLDRTR